MHFHPLRRHRRRLLLPPGLVALAGLLLLGCLALRPWQERLRRHSWIELRLPPRPVSDLIWPTIDREEPCLDYKTIRILKKEFRYSLFPHYRQWSTLTIGQSQQADSLAIRRLRTLLHSVGAHPNWGSGGLRIYFTPNAHYSSLINVLDLANRYRLQQYFVDINHQPITFYAYTSYFASDTNRLSCQPLTFR